VLVFEQRVGIAKLARLTASGLDVELFHILTFTLTTRAPGALRCRSGRAAACPSSRRRPTSIR
jgi:hypothetical protein